MSALALSVIVFFFIAVGALSGVLLRKVLPEYHLSADTKDTVRAGAGLIATIAALVLGLLIASAKNSFDAKNAQVKQLTVNTILLDNLLEQYGPEAQPARQLLRAGAATMTDRIWRENNYAHKTAAEPFAVTQVADEFFKKLESLAPATDTQKSIKQMAIQAGTDLARARLQLFAQAEDSMPLPFLAMLTLWLATIFLSFSLFANPNPVVIVFLLVFSLSAAGAIFMILELGQPFSGLLRIPSETLRNALVPLR